MFADARIQKIREILLEYKHVDINTLSTLLSVSMATIRRDLDRLEKENFITKTHGGAFLNEAAKDEVQLHNVEDPFLTDKSEIGLLAGALIEDNDVLFIGGGSTCAQIPRHIKEKKNVTIVTNNVNIIWEHAENKEINFQLLGGSLDTVNSNISTTGDRVIETLQSMYFSKVFLSVDGIDLQKGLFTNNPEMAKIFKLLHNNSDQIIIVADYRKFGRKAFSYIGPLTLIKKIVTNNSLNDEYKRILFEDGYQLYTTFNDL